MNHPTMSTPAVTVVLVVLVVLALLGVLAVLGVGRRVHRRTVSRVREASRVGRILGRVVGTGALLATVQAVVLAATTEVWVWSVVLGLPALVAGSAIHPLFTTTTVTHTRLAGRR